MFRLCCSVQGSSHCRCHCRPFHSFRKKKKKIVAHLVERKMLPLGVPPLSAINWHHGIRPSPRWFHGTRDMNSAWQGFFDAEKRPCVWMNEMQRIVPTSSAKKSCPTATELNFTVLIACWRRGFLLFFFAGIPPHGKPHRISWSCKSFFFGKLAVWMDCKLRQTFPSGRN